MVPRHYREKGKNNSLLNVLKTFVFDEEYNSWNAMFDWQSTDDLMSFFRIRGPLLLSSMYVTMSVSRSVCLNVCMFVFMFVYISVFMSFCMPVCNSICTFVCLYVPQRQGILVNRSIDFPILHRSY